MRIVYFSNTYHPTVSGVVTSIDAFREQLKAAGHDVHLIVPESNSVADTEPYIYRLPAVDLPGDFQFSLTLPARTSLSLLLEGIKPHLIHVQHPFLTGAAGASFAAEMNVPLIYTFHSRYDIIAQRYVPVSAIADLANQIVDEYLSKYLQKCSLVIAPTPSIKDFILDTYDPGVPVEVLPTPIHAQSAPSEAEVEKLRTRYGLRGKTVLVFIGRLAMEKNIDFLLNVFRRVRQGNPAAHLLLVGDGAYRDKLEALTDELDLQNAVTFTGYVPHDAVATYAALGRLFVFPSNSETQGLVLLEAMAAGVPVVATHGPGCTDVLSQGGGLLLPLHEDAWVQSLLALLSDPALLEAYRVQAREVAACYDVAPIGAQLAALYEQTISGYS